MPPVATSWPLRPGPPIGHRRNFRKMLACPRDRYFLGEGMISSARPLWYLPLALLVAIGFGVPRSASAATAPPPTVVKNTTYAGWSVHPQFGQAWEAAAHWTVPAVTCDAVPFTRPWVRSRAAVWVGTWGQPGDSNAWLPQVGTVSQCNDGGASKQYYAFDQMFHPGGSPQTVLKLKVQPGDKIYAFILYNGLRSGALTFQYWIENQSRHAHVTGIIATSSGVSMSKAMWEGGVILETQPDDQIGILKVGGLAKFKPIAITGAEVDGTALEKFPQVCTKVNGPCGVYLWSLRSPANYPKKVLALVGPRAANGKFTLTWNAFR